MTLLVYWFKKLKMQFLGVSTKISVKIFFLNTFIKKGQIKLIKTDSEDI